MSCQKARLEIGHYSIKLCAFVFRKFRAQPHKTIAQYVGGNCTKKSCLGTFQIGTDFDTQRVYCNKERAFSSRHVTPFDNNTHARSHGTLCQVVPLKIYKGTNQWTKVPKRIYVPHKHQVANG